MPNLKLFPYFLHFSSKKCLYTMLLTPSYSLTGFPPFHQTMIQPVHPIGILMPDVACCSLIVYYELFSNSFPYPRFFYNVAWNRHGAHAPSDRSSPCIHLRTDSCLLQKRNSIIILFAKRYCKMLNLFANNSM